jgi:ABC-2 type transport system ATP-binding protein
MNDNRNTHTFTITTEQLTRRFGDVTAVEGLALQVPRGSVYGFLGPNGAGKTTTIRMLLGLIRPDDGEVHIFGQSLRENRLPILRQVGALVESPSLYDHLTGRENLALKRKLTGGRSNDIDRALTVVRLAEAADRRVHTYSLGMKQRLALALALMGNPRLLILDEPTNGLDPAGIHEMRDLICRLPEEQGITVFLSSHLLSEVEQVATHIGIINQGHLLFQGPPEALHAQVDHHLTLEVDQPQRAKHVLQQAGWSIKRNGNHQMVISVNGHSDVAMLNAQLVHNGVNVYHLYMERPTLESMFLALTTDV